MQFYRYSKTGVPFLQPQGVHSISIMRKTSFSRDLSDQNWRETIRIPRWHQGGYCAWWKLTIQANPNPSFWTPELLWQEAEYKQGKVRFRLYPGKESSGMEIPWPEAVQTCRMYV